MDTNALELERRCITNGSAILLLLLLTACSPLAPGHLEAVGSVSTDAPTAVQVCLIRGWRDLYSSGMDRLGDELRQTTPTVEVFREEQWRDLASALGHRLGSLHQRPKLILIGFSYGADDVVNISRQLADSGIDVDLLITIDPVTPAPVPENVQSCYNFFQTNGVWDVFPWLRGIPLKAERASAHLVNVDIRRDRPDLLESDTAHSNIAANPKLHREIAARVLEICAASGKH